LVLRQETKAEELLAWWLVSEEVAASKFSIIVGGGQLF
jgi:hypothetical protein